MPNGQPAQVANRKPFTPGNTAPRRSGDVNKAITLARKHSPEAIQTAIECMRDDEAIWSERLKAAQLVLNAGLPKDSDAVEKFFGDSGDTAFIEVRFVKPGEVIEHEAKRNGQHSGIFSMSFGAE